MSTAVENVPNTYRSRKSALEIGFRPTAVRDSLTAQEARSTNEKFFLVGTTTLTIGMNPFLGLTPDHWWGYSRDSGRENRRFVSGISGATC
jgi:hypothetical protein